MRGTHLSAAPWTARYETILRQYLPLLEHNQPIYPEVSLIDLGLDSLSMVDLLLELEKHFSIKVPEDLLVERTFASPNSLWSVVHMLSTHSPDAPTPANEPNQLTQ